MQSKSSRFGEILLHSGRIDKFQLDSALSHQRNCGGRLGESLIKLGYISEEELLQCLAQQLKLPRVDLFKQEVAPEVLACIPFDKAREHNILPVERRESHGNSWLLVAMSDPTNLLLIDTLQFMSGCRVKPVLAPAADIRDAIRHYYEVPASVPVSAPSSARRMTSRPETTVSTEGEKLQALMRLLLEKGILSLREYERLK